MVTMEDKETKETVEALLNVDALAQATGISRFQWYRFAKGGKIPTYRAGKSVRFKLSEILQWMKEDGK